MRERPYRGVPRVLRRGQVHDQRLAECTVLLPLCLRGFVQSNGMLLDTPPTPTHTAHTMNCKHGELSLLVAGGAELASGALSIPLAQREGTFGFTASFLSSPLKASIN